MTDNTTPSNPYAAPEGNLSASQQSDAGVLASLGSRFGAAFIDGIIMSIVTVIPLFVFTGGWSGYLAKVLSGGYLFVIGVTVFAWAAYLLVNGYFLAQSGQSLGKKMVGIKIVRTDGSQPSLSHIVVRRLGPMYIARLIPVIGPFLNFIDIVLIFRSSRQCAHDQIADTVVVNA